MRNDWRLSKYMDCCYMDWGLWGKWKHGITITGARWGWAAAEGTETDRRSSDTDKTQTPAAEHRKIKIITKRENKNNKRKLSKIKQKHRPWHCFTAYDGHHVSVCLSPPESAPRYSQHTSTHSMHLWTIILHIEVLLLPTRASCITAFILKVGIGKRWENCKCSEILRSIGAHCTPFLHTIHWTWNWAHMKHLPWLTCLHFNM